MKRLRMLLVAALAGAVLVGIDGHAAEAGAGAVDAGSVADRAAAVASIPAAQVIGARLLFQQSQQAERGGDFLRQLALGLSGGEIDLDEAERLLAWATRFGVIDPPVGTAPAAAAATPVDRAASLGALLDGPAAADPATRDDADASHAAAGDDAAASTDWSAPLSGAKRATPADPAFDVAELSWLDTECTGVVKRFQGDLDGSGGGFALIAHRSGPAFEQGHTVLVRRGGRDLARDVVIQVSAGGAAMVHFGPDAWLDAAASKKLQKGDEAVVQERGYED